MLICHQGQGYQPTLKREIVHISKFQNKILYQSKKNTWYILYFIEALAGSQMKVEAVLNNLYNFISNPCTMYAPIKYTNSQYVQFALYTIYKISYNSISKPCVEQKKKRYSIRYLKIFHGTSICQLFLKIQYIPILRNVPAVCPMFQWAVPGTACQFHHVCFIRIQLYTFKVYQVNSAAHMVSIQENIHYPITI